MATLAEKRSDAMQIVQNPDEYSKKEVMEAKKILKEYDAIQKPGKRTMEITPEMMDAGRALKESGKTLKPKRPKKSFLTPEQREKMKDTKFIRDGMRMIPVTEKMRGKEQDDRNKTKMRKGGMANGKPHLYLSDGALVVDKLPNAGTKALAKTAKGRQALRNMKLI